MALVDPIAVFLAHTFSALGARMEWMNVSSMLDTIKSIWVLLQEQVQMISLDLPSQMWNAVPRNALLPLFAMALVFWPLLVSLLYAFMAASTWIIWLLTSFLLGCLQCLYVGYQFIMITGDLCGFFILKSYSMICHMILNNLSMKHKSSRRIWRERLDAAGSYENFLKIRIGPKEETMTSMSKDKSKRGHQQQQPLDAAAAPPPSPPLPARQEIHKSNMVRSSSFDSSMEAAATSKMPRPNSFGNLSNFFHRHASDPSGTFNAPASNNKNDNASNDDKNSMVDPVIAAELGERAAYLLVTTTERLMDARRQAERCSFNPDNNDNDKNNNSQEAWNRLQYLLSAVMKRNHLHLESVLIDNAQAINNTGKYGLSSQTRQAIRAFYEQVQKGLDFMADAPAFVTTAAQRMQQSQDQLQPQLLQQQRLPSTEEEPQDEVPLIPQSMSPPSSPSSAVSWSSEQEQHVQQQQQNDELLDRIRVLRKMKHNMGRTALMLSGGGAQAMYHIGVLRALIESKLYQDISVISGTSGGSITAAMCATRTPEELFQHVCVPNVSTDFGSTGEQKRKNIRWFPTAMEMVSYWFKHKLLMNIDEFRRTCEFYYGDMTFEEAFERTGKHVCISVSASRANADSALQRLLLNHISTPRVTLASAVAASCALPGVMAPTKLMTKNSSGQLEPFEVDGVDWIDGSVQADIPFQRIATMFAVSNFIVSQTNFHIVPLLNKEFQPDQKSSYRKLLLLVEWDIRSRALKLSRLGLFPKIFGQDMSKAFEQKYHGNLTIVPRLTTTQTFGLRTLSNPTYEDMQGYIKYGEIATWPFLNAIRDIIRLEKVIDDCLNRLEHRLGNLNPDWYDDVESLTSSHFRDHHPYLHRGGGSTSGGGSSSHHHNGAVGSLTPPSSRVVKISCAGFSLAFPGTGRHHNHGGSNSNHHNGTADEKLRRRTKKLEEENRALKEKLLQLEQLVEKEKFKSQQEQKAKAQ